MSPSYSRAAIRLFVAYFLAQSLVNAAAVYPHPHVHQVLSPRQVVSIPVVEAPSTEDDDVNVFDALINTLKGYNGWQVFQSFFEKLFNGGDNNNDDDDDVPVIPTSSVNVVSVVASIFSEVIASAEPTGEVFSILPVGPLTTAVDLFPTDDITFITPTATISPVAISVNVTAPTATISPVAISLNVSTPTNPLILTAPLLVPTEVPVLNVTGELNSTVSLTSTLELTLTIPPLPLATGTGSVGTGLPLSDAGSVFFPNVTTVTPTIVLGTGTGAATIAPTVVVSPLFPNGTDVIEPVYSAPTAVSVGTALPSSIADALGLNATLTNTTTVPVVVFGTGALSTASATVSAIVDAGALFPNVTAGATPAVTQVVALGTGTAVIASAGTIIGSIISDAAAPLFPNATAVVPTIISGTGVALVTAVPLVTAPIEVGTVGTILATPIVDTAAALFPNATTTTTTIVVTPTGFVGTAVTAVVEPSSSLITIVAPAPTADGNTTIVIVPTPDLSIVSPVSASIEPLLPIVDTFPTPTAAPIVEPLLPAVSVVDNATVLAVAPTPSVALSVGVAAAVPTAVVAPLAPVVPIAPLLPAADEPAVEFPGTLPPVSAL
jgi:hypothetical protein